MSKKAGNFQHVRRSPNVAGDEERSVRQPLNKFQQKKLLARKGGSTRFSQLVDESMKALGLGKILGDEGRMMGEPERPTNSSDVELYRITASELALLEMHLQFYIDLTSGKHRPTTEAQKHFISVSMGHDIASTDHERAFMKWRRKMALGRSTDDSTGKLEQAPPGLRPYPASVSAKLDQAYDPGLSPRYQRPRER